MDILIYLLTKLADEAFAFAFPKVRDAVGLNPKSFAFRRILIRSAMDFLPKVSFPIKVFINPTTVLGLNKEFSKFLTHDQTPDVATIVNIVKDAQQPGETIPDDETLLEAIRGWIQWIENVIKEDSELRDIVTLRGVELIERGMNAVQRSMERLHKDMVGDLESKICPTTNYFKGLGINQFAGRGWIETEIGKFLEDNDRGYITIEAESGLGKTTFLAALVEKSKQEGKNYIHQFCALTSDNISAIQNIAAQLILRFDLQNFHLNEIHDLFNVVHAAAEQRKEGEKIVIVVDALDETGVEDNRYNLKLPRFIPEGVYFIVSIRPGYPQLDFVPFIPYTEIQITAEDENNRNDIRIYLSHQFSVDPIKTLQAKTGKSRQYWIDTVLEMSEGNWMYIIMALQDVRENNKLDLNALPKGLTRYYLRNFWKWKTQAMDWENELRILSTLAAVKQGITLEQVRRWGILDLSEEEIISIYKKAGWKSIVRERDSESDQEKRYQFIHSSLIEFFHGDWSPSLDSERKDHKELTKNARFVHSQIADFYLAHWGRLENQLPKLRIREDRSIDQYYGIRSLLFHLERAERFDDIHRLLKLEWVSGERRENAWYSARSEDGDMRGYTHDIQQAWRLVNQSVQKNQQSEYNLIGLQVRYALIISSLNSISTRIPSPLIAALVEKQIWSSELALSYVRLVPDLYQREQALIHIIPTLFEEDLDEALVIAFELMDQYVTEAFIRLAPRLSNRNDLIRKSWEKICKLELPGTRLVEDEILALAPILPTEYQEEALDLLMKSKTYIDDEFFLTIIPKLSMKLLTEVRKFYKNDQGEIHLPVMVDLAIAARYSGQRRESEITRAINGLAEVENWRWRYRLQDLAFLQNDLKISLPQQLLMKIFHRISNLDDESDRVLALIELYPFLTPEDRCQALSVSLATIYTMDQESSLINRIEDVMPLLAAPDIPGILDLSKNKLSADLHIAVLHAAAKHHPNFDLSEWVTEVWERILKQTPMEVGPAVQIIPYLKRRQKSKILPLIKQIYEEEDQVKVLAALIPVLPERSYQKVFAFIEGLSSPHLKAEPLSILGQHIRFENPLFEQIFVWSEFLYDHCDYLLLLTSLIPSMPDESRREPLVKALHAFLNAPTSHYTEEQRDSLERSFKALIPFLTDDLYNLAINKLEKYYDRQFQIAILIPHVQQAHLVQLVKILAGWGYQPIISIRVLPALLGRPDVPGELLEDMLKIYECINDQNNQSDLEAIQKAIAGSGTFLPGGLADEILTVANSLSDENRWWLLANYLPGLRDEERMQEIWVMEIGQVLKDEIIPNEAQLDFYTKLVPNLSKTNLSKLIEKVSAVAHTLPNHRVYANERIICALVPFLYHGTDRTRIIERILDYRPHIKARALLIHCLVGEELDDVLNSEINTIIAMKDTLIFPDLVPFIPEHERDEQVSRFLEILVEGTELGSSSYDYLTPYLFDSKEKDYSTIEKAVYGRINYPSLKKIIPLLSESAITLLFSHLEKLITRSVYKPMDAIVILACIMPILSDKLLERALEVVNKIESRRSSPQSFSPDLPTVEKRERLIDHYLNILNGCEWPENYCAPLLGQAILANSLPSGREDLLNRILATMRAVSGSLDRINTFHELASQLGHASLIQAFLTGALTNDSRRRAHYFYAFGQRISQIPYEVLYPKWENNLHYLSGRVRKDLLVDIFYLYPVIRALGGPDAVTETLHALLDVGAWWY